MSRPRGTDAGDAAAAVPAMNIVRGWPMGALAPDAAAPMRVPHAPQNAKPAWTMRPQLGHGISAAGAPGAGAPVMREGAGVTPPLGRGTVTPASGFGGS